MTTGEKLARLLATLALLTAQASGPTCYEDEVIVWTGEAHDACVPLDVLLLEHAERAAQLQEWADNG